METIEVIILGIAVFFPLILIWLFSGNSSTPTSSPQLRRLEKKLDMIMQNLGIEYQEEPMSEVMQALMEGRKIEAIKLYRTKTGLGLKEAKDMVEEMERGMH